MRHILHVVISLAMWCLFGYYWYVVLQREIPGTTVRALGILSVVVVAGLIATFWWVHHNMRLARRNRRNTPPPTKPETFTHDTLGRVIAAPDPAELKRAKVVDIAVAGVAAEGTRTKDEQTAAERKVYTIAPERAS
jgi:hypothetical protein